jgi:hypothetical protein
VESTVVFPNIDTAVHAFPSARATAVAVPHSGRRAVEQALTEALRPRTDDLGTVTLPGWFRVVEGPRIFRCLRSLDRRCTAQECACPAEVSW